MLFLDKILYVIVLWIKKKEAQNLRWPRELNALQIEKNTCKLRKQLHHFDITCAANAHNTTKQRNSLQIKLFVCIVSICRTCCQIDEDVFFFCWCFFYLHVFSEVAVRWALSATVQNSPIAFRGGSLCKNPRKIQVFWRGFPGKIHIAGAKYHFIGFALTCGHEKQPVATDFKVAQFRGKTADLATLSVGDVLPAWEWSYSPMVCSQTHLQ